MPHAIQIRQTRVPEVLNWTPIEVGESGSGHVRLRQAAAGLNHRCLSPHGILLAAASLYSRLYRVSPVIWPLADGNVRPRTGCDAGINLSGAAYCIGQSGVVVEVIDTP
jgi:hypothetical protein